MNDLLIIDLINIAIPVVLILCPALWFAYRIFRDIKENDKQSMKRLDDTIAYYVSQRRDQRWRQ